MAHWELSKIFQNREETNERLRENKQKREWDFNVASDYSAIIYHIKEL